MVQSGYPFHDPVGCVKLCLMQDVMTIIIDLMPHQIQHSQCELLYVGNQTNCLMMEFFANGISQEQWMEELLHTLGTEEADSVAAASIGQQIGILEASVMRMIQVAHVAVQPIIDAQDMLQQNQSKQDSTEEGNNGLKSSNKFIFHHLVRDFGLENVLVKENLTSVDEMRTIHNNDDYCKEAEILFEEAYRFIQEQVSVVCLALFGYKSFICSVYDVNKLPSMLSKSL